MKKRGIGITRRRLATIAAGAAPAAATLLPQATLSQTTRASAAEELAAARDQAKLMTALLRNEKIARMLEPGFLFRP